MHSFITRKTVDRTVHAEMILKSNADSKARVKPEALTSEYASGGIAPSSVSLVRKNPYPDELPAGLPWCPEPTLGRVAPGCVRSEQWSQV